MARFDPLSTAEFQRMLDATSRMTWTHGAPVDARYLTVLRSLRFLGCHPAVLAEPALWSLDVRLEPDGWVARWRRPKTKKLCQMPIPAVFAPELQAYLRKPYSVAMIRRIVNRAGQEAGLGKDVGPRTLRHTVAFEVFQAAGPGRARDKLGVSEKVLSDYAALGDRETDKILRKKFNRAESPTGEGEPIP